MKSGIIQASTTILLALLVLAGCTSPTPHLDQNWGRSFEAAKYSQTLNPDAGQATTPVTGMEGERAARADQQYSETFETAQPRPVYNINMPGVSSSR
jgi:outer membrane biogenesis lipoprotein LolB